MLRARHAEDGVIYSNQKIGRLSFELSGERWFAHVLDDVVLDENPELPRSYPNTAFVTDDLSRVFRHTNTSK